MKDEQEYLEQETQSTINRNATLRDLAATQPRVPMPIPTTPDRATAAIRRAFAQMDEVGLGAALGVVGGLLSSLNYGMDYNGRSAGGETCLQLLSQCFIGSRINWSGAVGSLYGGQLGFVVGWSVAYLRNKSLKLYLYLAKLMEEIRSLQEP